MWSWASLTGTHTQRQSRLCPSHGTGAVLAGVHPMAQGFCFLASATGVVFLRFYSNFGQVGMVALLRGVDFFFFLLTVISKEIIFNECVLFFLLSA